MVIDHRNTIYTTYYIYMYVFVYVCVYIYTCYYIYMYVCVYIHVLIDHRNISHAHDGDADANYYILCVSVCEFVYEHVMPHP
jgi:hypothetical protein